MNKNQLVNLLLVLFSVGLMLFVAEILLRSILFSSNKTFDFLREPSFYAVYPKDSVEDYYNDDYWKLNYLFTRPKNSENLHPLLGLWNKFDPSTYLHGDSKNVKGRVPVLFYGDSFVQCVDSVRCFDEFMNSDSVFIRDHYMLNYGIGGYGVDQTYLLFEKSIKNYDNAFVIFSLLTSDLNRSALSVRDVQKPYFEIQEGQLELKGVPILASSDDYFFQNPPNIKSYIWNRVYNKLPPYFKSSNDSEKAKQQLKNLNKLILEKTFAQIKAAKLRSIILIFKPTWQEDGWRLPFIKELCESNNMPYIVNDDLIKEDMIESGRGIHNYFIKNDGHPTSLANRIVSKELLKQILIYDEEVK